MISFSGIDCSGKSTQIELLCNELKKQNKNGEFPRESCEKNDY